MMGTKGIFVCHRDPFGEELAVADLDRAGDHELPLWKTRRFA
jgi:hypothetical protein